MRKPVLALFLLPTALWGCNPPPSVGPAAPSSTSGASPVTTSTACSGLPVTQGLQIWLDAGNLNVGDGGKISAWNDCHNTQLSAAPFSSAGQPTYSAAGGPGNKPYVRFDGTSSNLVISHSQVDFSNQALSYFAVLLMDTYVSGSKFVLSKPNAFYFYFGAPGPWYWFQLGSAINTVRAPDPTTAWMSDNVIFGSDTAIEYQNGIPFGTTGAGAGPLTTSTYDVYLFSYFNGTKLSSFSGGKLAELIMYNTALSDSDRASVQCYLNTKYGLDGEGCPQ